MNKKMKKLSLYMMALLSMVLVSCDQDFLTEFLPQSNLPESQLKMSDVSVHFGYTEEAFCRKFRQMFHCTLHQFLTRLRIQKAAGKIRMTGVGYANIAVTCGFPSLRSMNHYMKSLTGFSPAEIRALSERDYQDLLERL